MASVFKPSITIFAAQMKSIIRFLFSMVIVVHCLGLTQLASALAKDKSAFVTMLNMTEEETKKDKESKECKDGDKDVHRLAVLASVAFLNSQCFSFLHSRQLPAHQFLSECPTPPPDLAA